MNKLYSFILSTFKWLYDVCQNVKKAFVSSWRQTTNVSFVILSRNKGKAKIIFQRQPAVFPGEKNNQANN